ncbi:RNA polymerase sigma factor [Sphingobium sp. DN12]|uniref:RNA polymerase sigma factor n=1 Tax=Sphingobium sp. DN12 TaxID=3378073 RepID=UPI003DA412EC
MPTNAVALSRVLIAERSSLIRLARRIVGSGTVAEDIAQTAWLRIQRVEDEPPITDKRGFLYRMVLNLASDQRRSALRASRLFDSGDLPEDVASSEPDAEAVAINRDLLGRMAQAVEELPPRCREVFVMRKIDGLTPAEIADRLGISTNMVAKHVRIALQHCLERLEQKTDK